MKHVSGWHSRESLGCVVRVRSDFGPGLQMQRVAVVGAKTLDYFTWLSKCVKNKVHCQNREVDCQYRRDCQNRKLDVDSAHAKLGQSRSLTRSLRSGIRDDNSVGVNRASPLDLGMNGINRGGAGPKSQKPEAIARSYWLAGQTKNGGRLAGAASILTSDCDVPNTNRRELQCSRRT
jgi:hypothetical protein